MTARVLPSPVAVATAGKAAAAERSVPAVTSPDRFEVAVAAAFSFAAVYPVADNAVEVCISPVAVSYSVGGDLLSADSIAESAGTVILDLAAEAAGVPLSSGHITTEAPGVLRLTW